LVAVELLRPVVIALLEQGVSLGPQSRCPALVHLFLLACTTSTLIDVDIVKASYHLGSLLN
jgi:hypothetical protein